MVLLFGTKTMVCTAGCGQGKEENQVGPPYTLILPSARYVISGYWYKNGCMFPDMLTAFIAVDKCIVENGCMSVSVHSGDGE